MTEETEPVSFEALSVELQEKDVYVSPRFRQMESWRSVIRERCEDAERHNLVANLEKTLCNTWSIFSPVELN